MRNLDEIKQKQYWTTVEAAAVIGRSGYVIKSAFDSGDIKGHWTGKGQGHRRINADSARAYFRRLDGERATVAQPEVIGVAERIAMFRRGKAHA